MTNSLPHPRRETVEANLISVLQERTSLSASTAAASSSWMRAEPRDLPSTSSGTDATMCGAMSALVGELVESIDRADPSQAGHASRVAALSTMLGSSIGMSVNELRALRVSALLHDVGKILVPTEILRKNGPLTSSETAEMRRHVVYGGAILSRIPVLAFAASTARWHHERWDGLGYPDRLVGHAIPLYARIVAVADALDAQPSALQRPLRNWNPSPVHSLIHSSCLLLDHWLALRDFRIHGFLLQAIWNPCPLQPKYE
jgi:HD-GYP domain-containing protein (c-di-GMP phosphodiesterase class II)